MLTVNTTRFRYQWLLLALVCLAGGCASLGRVSQAVPTSPNQPNQVIASNEDLLFPERLDKGYTLYLPGIFGANKFTIIQGLKRADVPTAVEFFDWTKGPGMFVYNHLNRPRNRQLAKEAAAKIIAYQQQYPGRPVHLVGYSGGGTMAVMTLEAMPPGTRVTNAVIIGSTMAMNYDLRTAMTHTEQGIHNFYSYLDVPMLEGFCLLTGTGDGRYTLSSGMVGFYPPRSLSPQEREAYAQNLHQQPFEPGMLKDGHWGGHFGWIGPVVLERHIAPLLNTPSQRLPAVLAGNTTPQQHSATLLRISATEEMRSK